MLDEASVYLTIKNAGGRDILLGAKTSIPGASAGIHEMRLEFTKPRPQPMKQPMMHGHHM